MGIVRECPEETLHVLVQQGVPTHVVTELVELVDVGQFTPDQQVTGFEERATFSELFDRVAPVPKNPFFTV